MSETMVTTVSTDNVSDNVAASVEEIAATEEVSDQIQWQNLVNQIQSLALTVQSSLQQTVTTLQEMASTLDGRMQEMLSTQQRTITELTSQITASQAILLNTLIQPTSTMTEQFVSAESTPNATEVETPAEIVIETPVQRKRPRL